MDFVFSLLLLPLWLVNDVQEGFENIPQTLTRLFTGQNRGKQLLKIADSA